MANTTDWGSRLNKFYAAQYAWLLRIMNLLFVVMFVLFGIILYLEYKKPWPSYFQSAADGSIKRIYALTSPMVGPRALRDWATQAATSAYTYNFNDYDERFAETSVYFTPSAWSAFVDSISSANIIDNTVTKKLIVSSVRKGAAVIVDQRIISGVWTWRVQVPILVSYRGGVAAKEETLVVNMLITRVPTTEVSTGIAISQFYAYPLGGGSALR